MWICVIAGVSVCAITCARVEETGVRMAGEEETAFFKALSDALFDGGSKVSPSVGEIWELMLLSEQLGM